MGASVPSRLPSRARDDETRLNQDDGLCWPRSTWPRPAEAEGFTDVSYGRHARRAAGLKVLTGGGADISMNFVGRILSASTRVIQWSSWPAPRRLLRGVRRGTLGRSATSRARRVGDSGNGTSTCSSRASPPMSGSTAQGHHLGRPRGRRGLKLFAEVRWTPTSASPADPELRARKIGRVIVNSTADRPWSQYFCCLVTGSREFVAKSRWRPSARYARFSRRPTSAPPSPTASPVPRRP